MKPETQMSEPTPTNTTVPAQSTDTSSETVAASPAEATPEVETAPSNGTTPAVAEATPVETAPVEYDEDGEVIGYDLGEAETEAEAPQNSLSQEEWDGMSGEEKAIVKAALEESVVEQISTIFDPEIPVNIYELGLIYEVIINDDRHAVVQMTLTSPACPVAGTLPLEVEEKTKTVDGVESARVELVWDPPWTPEMMSEAAKLELGFFY